MIIRLLVLMQITCRDGIEIIEEGRKILIDPRHAQGADAVFISHSHADHLPAGSMPKVLCQGTHPPNPEILCSRETAALASARGKELGKTSESLELGGLRLEMKPNGHILGSRALTIDNGKKVVYTSDVSTQSRAFLKGYEPEKCDVLIIEATFGLPCFMFPNAREIEKEAKDWVNETIGKGESAILMGYSLGKSQVISYLFKEYAQYFHEEVEGINAVYRNFGVSLPEERKDNRKDPFIMVSPPLSQKNKRLDALRKKHKIRTAIFSGWAGSGFRGYDKAFPLSDHCDFLGLKRIVEKSRAEKIYTVHGYAREFAARLQKLGYNAHALGDKQKTIGDFE